VSDDLTAALSALATTLPAAAAGICRYQGDLAEVASRATALRERVLALADSLPAPLPCDGPLAEALGLSAAARSADGANALLCRHADALALVATLAGTLAGAVERAGVELEASIPAHALLPAPKAAPLCDHCDCYHPPTEACEPGAAPFEEVSAANPPAAPAGPPALVPGDLARAEARADLDEEWPDDDSAGCGDDGGVLGGDEEDLHGLSPVLTQAAIKERDERDRSRNAAPGAQERVLVAHPDAVLRECSQGKGQVMYRVAVPGGDGTHRWVGARRRTPESAWRSAADRLEEAPR
jgi:hypothetical protein